MEKSIFQFLEIRKVAMNMIYRKLYPCSQDEFKEKFISYSWGGETMSTRDGDVLVTGSKPKDKIVIIYTMMN